MNKLSLLLYLADVSEKLSTYLYGLAVAFILAYVGINAVKTINTAHHNETQGSYREGYRPYGLIRHKILALGIAFLIGSSIVPSRETMYLIAASEVGETIILSPEMKETMGKIKDVIDRKLDEMAAVTTEETDT